MSSIVKNLLLRSNSRLLGRFLPFYPFHMRPAHLAFLIQCIEQTRTLSGPIVEVGCAEGWTSVFLNAHMDFSKVEKTYFCIDTFSGFCQEDVRYEKEVRGKGAKFPSAAFSINKKSWFDRTMQLNGIMRVRSIQADVKQYDFEGIADISLCLIDVDLYLPVKAALEKLSCRMAPGGIIIVDDCMPNGHFDGARQAYSEFVVRNGLQENIVLEKFGIIEIGASQDLARASPSHLVR